MKVVAGFPHTHVSEREQAHQSPCGWDDAKWEDCTFMSALEWWRATGHPETPATHEEGEHLRCASGRSMLGGTNLTDVKVAIAKRYGGTTPTPVKGFAALWAKLAPGTVAVATGSMGAFPTGSRWRRWDAGFAGAHAVCVFRADATDRVWWCDPLAPTSYKSGTTTRAYDGEWMSKADFKLYVDGFGGSHLVGKVAGATEEETIMREFDVVNLPTGTLTIAQEGVWYLDMTKDTMHGPIGPLNWPGGKTPILPVRLRKPIIAGKPDTDDWKLGYIVGSSPAFVLARNVTITPPPSNAPLPPTILVGASTYRKE